MGGHGLVNIEHMHKRRLLMLSRNLQTSCDPLVREYFDLNFQLPFSKSLLSKANKFATDLELNNTSRFTSGQLKNTICSAQWQKIHTTLCD